MCNNKKRFIIFCLISILFEIILPFNLYAISIRPARTELTLAPGEGYDGEFVVSNTLDEPVKVLIFLEDGLLRLKKKDVSKWIKLYSNEMILSPKKTQNLRYKVSVPKKVSGEYAPTIIFRERPIGRKVQAIAQIKMPIYIFIKGTEVYKGEIESFQVISAKPLIVSILVRNLGNVHTRPTGYLEIKKIITKKRKRREIAVTQLEVNKKQGPIFGGSIGEIGVRYDEGLPEGRYIASLVLNYTPTIVLKKKLKFEVTKTGEVSYLLKRQNFTPKRKVERKQKI